MDSPPHEYSLASITSKACTVSYQQLRQILTALPNKDDATKKSFLLKYAINARHAFARLLAVLRWHKLQGTTAARANLVEDAAIANAQVFEDTVDNLWDISAYLSNKLTTRPAVASAVTLLTKSASHPPHSTSHSKPENPRPLKRPRLTPDFSEVTQQLTPSITTPSARPPKPSSFSLGAVSPSVTERLGIATRNCVRESQLHIGAVQVLSWRSGLADVCVSIGVPALWAADVSLDSLDPHLALLRVHSIRVFVASHIDAPQDDDSHWSSQRTTVNGQTSNLTSKQHALLRRMADDRMSTALKAVRAMTKSNSDVNSCSIMICALRDMMADEVCAPLAMDCLRAQARALCDGPWSAHIKVEGADPNPPRNTPLTISYWLPHRHPALIRIQQYPSTISVASPDAETPTHPQTERFRDVDRACISCVHEPALPNAVELGKPHPSFVLQMNRLNLEDQLCACIKLRSCARITSISNAFLERASQLRVDPSCIMLSESRIARNDQAAERCVSANDVVSIRFGGSSATGIDFRIYNLTGGLRIRPYGAAALAVPLRRESDSNVWVGARQFESKSQEIDACIRAFEVIRARVKLDSAARSVCALDIGVSNTLPPGTASVAATASRDRAASQLVPPFAPLERRAPRRFLTLSPPPNSKDALNGLRVGTTSSSRYRTASARGFDRSSSSKRPRLTYATTSDSLVFIQESSFAGGDWRIGARDEEGCKTTSRSVQNTETDSIDRYSGTAAAAAAWAVTREVVERRLKRDSLIRAFYRASVFAQMHHMRTSEDSDLHLESASRVLLRVKCEPLPVRRAELLLRGYDVWQVRFSLLPSIFDSTDSVAVPDGSARSRCSSKSRGTGNLWSVGVSCTGSQLTFTYPSANPESVCSFFRDLTRARTAAALARGVPPSRFYRVLRRSPVRIVVGIGPYGPNQGVAVPGVPPPKPQYTATVEYVYSKGNSGGFSLSFSPSKQTMEQLAPLIEEALDASGGQVGGVLAGLLERACPVAAAAESAVREKVNGRIRFLTALRVRAMFAGFVDLGTRGHPQPGAAKTEVRQGVRCHKVAHAVDVDARGGGGLVTVIDVGRATSVMIQQGFVTRNHSSGPGTSGRGNDYVSLPKWDEVVASVVRDGYAEPQRADSTIVLKMEMLETFLSRLVSSAASTERT
ncbi:hypothetical protein BWQ96_09817 [Gracilariopsis chorda]|uniref:Mediator of RNA polymerase II transcription subunit 14 n=1 Tax=Gracilariopsis chorda TaxID=448386 RepID=A0A2V3IEM5_9FLOR|nr:hypothetical protein BWQ96_09817 [Gracilariopsis chorda]|eukprot:PXF40468.1 hypothetical protein BWQ96_09817 [Gracilariopsis chorda]